MYYCLGCRGQQANYPGPMSGEDCGHVTWSPPMRGGVRVTSLSLWPGRILVTLLTEDDQTFASQLVVETRCYGPGTEGLELSTGIREISQHSAWRGPISAATIKNLLRHYAKRALKGCP